ncbi:MAG: TonB family protein [Alistipes sp.]|nr:TonB family protein [Alistipes sp.]
MMRLVLYFIIIFGGLVSASAQNIDVVYTSDGSVYDGVIIEQIPGDKITVTTNLAVKYVASEKISDISCSTVDVASLTSPLKTWVEKNMPDSREVELASLKMMDAQFNNVIILERGETYKLLIGETAHFILKWSNIVKTNKHIADNHSLKEIIIQKNGKIIEGNITEQVIGKHLTIKSDSNEEITVNFADVEIIQTEGRDVNSSLWSQIRYLDKIELNDGTSVKGFIVARTLGKSVTCITEADEAECQIELKNIKRYNKIKNGKFNSSAVSQEDNDNAPAEQQEDVPLLKVDKMPTFQGGDLNKFRNWVQNQVRYPAEAIEAGISGRVVCSFIVEKDGSLSEFAVMRTPDKILGDEVVRVLKNSPKWEPGMHGDEKVRVKYSIPIVFILPSTREKVASASAQTAQTAQTTETTKTTQDSQQDQINSDYTINGTPVATSDVVETENKQMLVYSIYAVESERPIIKVSNDKPIVIKLPANVDVSDVHIVKTERRAVKVGMASEIKDCHTFSRKDINKSKVNFLHTQLANEIEIKISSIDSGIYALYPIMVNGKEECLMFEVL